MKVINHNYIVHDLIFQIMNNVDKAGLIDDAFNLARAGYIDYTIPLNLIKFLDKELNHLPWESAYNGIGYISDMLQTGSSFSLFRVSMNCKDDDN